MELIKKIWKNRYHYAQYIALVATLLSVVGFTQMMSSMDGERSVIWPLMFGLGLMLTAVAYILGGLLTALKCSLQIAKWGWLVVPFPFDIATGVAAFGVSILVFLLVPIIPIRKAAKEHQLEY